jgi:hypothetical protein
MREDLTQRDSRIPLTPLWNPPRRFELTDMVHAHKFDEPIQLRDGRVISCTADARMLINSLPARHCQNPHWLCASELLLDAEKDRNKEAMANLLAQLGRALKAEGLI